MKLPEEVEKAISQAYPDYWNQEMASAYVSGGIYGATLMQSHYLSQAKAEDEAAAREFARGWEIEGTLEYDPSQVRELLEDGHLKGRRSLRPYITELEEVLKEAAMHIEQAYAQSEAELERQSDWLARYKEMGLE